MTNKFRARVPNYIDIRGLDIPEFEFETQDELENHEWLKRHTNQEDFKHFTYSKSGYSPTYYVIAVYDDIHFTIGFLDHIENIDWPEWKK